MRWTERAALKRAFDQIEAADLEAAKNAAAQLYPHRRVGYEAGLKGIHTEQAYQEIDDFVAREAGAAGITLAELDDISDLTAA